MKHSFPHLLECFSAGEGVDPHFRSKEQKRLSICMVITGLAMFLEFFGGIWTNSLALLSDAAHMFSHLFSLTVSYVAIWFAKKKADETRSYGFYRAEILAALFNGFTLFLIVVWIFYDAIQRFFDPKIVAVPEMLGIALVGLVVNLASAFILQSVSHHDLNVKSAFFHMLADTTSSIGIIIAGVVMYYAGYLWLDPAISILIAVMILIWSFQLLRDSVHILLESTPKHLNQTELVATIKKEIPEVHNLHHLHIWELTSKVCAFTAHVEIEDCSISHSEELRKKINGLLTERYHISHTNLQFECIRGRSP